jgi:hypothetical protein
MLLYNHSFTLSEMGIIFVRTIMISLAIAYLALTHHIFEENVMISFVMEHVIAICIGLFIALLIYVYRHHSKI